MTFNVESRAAVPARSHNFFAAVAQAMAAQFSMTAPAVRERAISLWWLAAFVCMGAYVRFWGLGAVGLHGDEETMAMAVRGILAEGWPMLPSGMFYPRGLTQLYLMALSVSLFGETEWALRLPSALCGIVLIGLSYAVGRRFLRPHWNLAFTASVAFLPELIVYSQTARMYIFMLTCVTASLACLFEWERSERSEWLIAAVIALIVGVDMQSLAVGIVLVFLLPGIVSGDRRKLALGFAALCVVALGFVLIEAGVNSQYPVPPPEFAASIGAAPNFESRAPHEFALTFQIALWAVGLVLAFFAIHISRTLAIRRGALASVVLLLGGIVLQLALFYHLAALAYLAGLVIAYRYSSSETTPRLISFLIAAGLVALTHAALLASVSGTMVKLVGALVGQPSVWPYVRVAQLSVAAGIIWFGLLIWGLYQLARARKVTDYWLLAVLGVWAPVFALGAFAWNIPPRYAAMSLAPMLLCAFASAQHATDWLFARWSPARGRKHLQTLTPAIVAVLIINPVTAAATINAGYRAHPDHKGAAEFMRAIPIAEDDIVLAEDVLQQTYYLGEVDYWLIGPQVARRFVKQAEGGVVDFYTGTPVIATKAMLDRLLQENPNKRIFIIGSGEGWRKGWRWARGPELQAAIESERFETLHIGRDGLTRILRARPGAITPSPATQAEAEADETALAEDAASTLRNAAPQIKKPRPAPAE